jgi:tocopherol O-methyltransferase
MITPRESQSPDAVAAHYDDLSSYYLDIWGPHLHHGLWISPTDTPEEAVRKLVEVVADEARITDGANVCDVGCGYGATARMLAAEYAADVTGFTLSQAQYDHARAAGGGPRYFLRDWMDNGLPDAAFDAVIAIESSEHMEDKARFFAEAARVLRPGGRVVVCAWLAGSAPSRLEVRHLLEPICREGRLPGLGSEEDYRALIDGAGLELARFQDVSAQVRKTWPICAARLARAVATQKAYRDLLLDSSAANRVFALTVMRIWVAYVLGSMRYGIFTAIAAVALFLGACDSAASKPNGYRVFVSNETDGTVSVIDGASRDVVATIPVGKRPRGLRVDGDTLYVALSGSPRGGPGVDESTLPPPDRSADGIGVVDLDTLTLTRVLESGIDPESFDLAGDALVVSNEETAEASIVERATGKVRARVTVGGEPEGVTTAPDGLVYVTSEEDAQVDVVDPRRAQVVARISTGPRPRAIAFANGRAYVTNENGASITVIDTKARAAVATIAIAPEHAGPTGARPMGIAIARDGKRAFVTTGRGGSVATIDLSANEVTRSVKDVGARPWGIAVAPDGLVFTANGSSDDVSVIDADSGAVLERIKAGASPWGIAISPR